MFYLLTYIAHYFSDVLTYIFLVLSYNGIVSHLFCLQLILRASISNYRYIVFLMVLIDDVCVLDFIHVNYTLPLRLS